MLLGGGAGQRLEPDRVVRGPALQRPDLHRIGHLVGNPRINRRAAADGPGKRLEGRVRKIVAHDFQTEHILPVDICQHLPGFALAFVFLWAHFFLPRFYSILMFAQMLWHLCTVINRSFLKVRLLFLPPVQKIFFKQYGNIAYM